MTGSKDRKLISVIVPCFNEEETVPDFVEAVAPVLDRTSNDWEIVFVDDGSRDRTLDIMLREADRDSRIKIVALARNFGKEAALSAGLAYCRGDCAFLWTWTCRIRPN